MANGSLGGNLVNQPTSAGDSSFILFRSKVPVKESRNLDELQLVIKDIC